MSSRPTTTRAEEAAVVAAVRGGDEAAFSALAERYRPQLLVHCYRMLGSLEEAEDLVQDPCCGPGGPGPAFRVERGSEPGCTGSPPTPA